MALGEVGYGKWCATCHQADGFGVRSVYPPLVGQAAWMASCEQHAGYVVHGLFGPIEVGGEVYDQLMPPLERSVDDVEVAAILTFVQNSWGNRYGACSPEAVVRAREAARPGPVAAGTSGSPTPSP